MRIFSWGTAFRTFSDDDTSRCFCNQCLCSALESGPFTDTECGHAGDYRIQNRQQKLVRVCRRPYFSYLPSSPSARHIASIGTSLMGLSTRSPDHLVFLVWALVYWDPPAQVVCSCHYRVHCKYLDT